MQAHRRPTKAISQFANHIVRTLSIHTSLVVFTHASPKGHTLCTCRLNVGHNLPIVEAKVTCKKVLEGVLGVTTVEVGLAMGQITSHSLTLSLMTNDKKGTTFRGSVLCPSHV